MFVKFSTFVVIVLMLVSSCFVCKKVCGQRMLSSYGTACVKRTALSVLKKVEFLVRSQREVLQIRVIILQCVTVRPFVLFNFQVVKRIFMKFCCGQVYKILLPHCIL